MLGTMFAQHAPLHGKRRMGKGVQAVLTLLTATLCVLLLVVSPAQAEDSSITGVYLGEGFTVYTTATVDQTSVPDAGLAAVIKWRQDALDDTNIKRKSGDTYVTMKEYLAQKGISESEYLNPKWSNTLERIAVQRVIENRDPSHFHSRLNGDNWWTAAYNGHQSWNEVLAWGNRNISSAVDNWAREKNDFIKETNGEDHGEIGHYYFLINPDNKEYGFGVSGLTASGETATSESVANDPAHFNLKGTYEFPVAVSDDVLSQGVNANVPSTMRLEDSFTPTATLVFTTAEWPSGKDTYQIHGTWTSSDPSVLSVASDDMVTAAGAGTATLTLTSQGKIWPYTVQVLPVKGIEGASVSPIEGQAYTGSAVAPAVTVTLNGATLTEGTDYTVSYSNNVYPGTATVAITGIGKYAGTITKSFNISGDISNAEISDIADEAYTGRPIAPTITVKFGGKTLVQDTDYTVAYADNFYPGIATVTIAGKGDYTGTLAKGFRIIGNLEKMADVTLGRNPVRYTGSPVTPGITVTFGSRTLAEGTDYTLSYKNNVDPGIGTAVVTGIGSYIGTHSMDFNIYADVSLVQIDDIPDQQYVGKAVTPSVTTRIAGKALTPGTDYEVSYIDNDCPGTARAYVIGTGTKFNGVTSKEFRISAPPTPSVSMYRLYNPWSGEHLFTQNKDEVDSLVRLGWKDEGIAWQSPSSSENPVYRLYNPYSGDHFYTMDVDEYNYLGSIGWNQEGISFYSASEETGKPIYRLFNRWLTQGTHLFTTSKSEYAKLGAIGWSQEGIAFYSP